MSNMLNIEPTDGSNGVLTPEQKTAMEQFIKDQNGTRFRQMTQYERDVYGGAIVNAIDRVPSFRDAIGLMRPFVDVTCATAYTDRYARMGLSYWFFYVADPRTRAFVLLHEALHVMNSHFMRAETLGLDNQKMNVCGDLEINTTLASNEYFTRIADQFLVPEKYELPAMKTLEYYSAHMPEDMMDKLQQDAQGDQGEDGDQQGQGGQGSSGQGQSGQQQGQGQGSGEPGEQGGSQSGSGSGSEDDESGEETAEGAGKFKRQMEDKNGGKGSKETHYCDGATEEREAGADAAGIDRASDSEQNIARQNVRARVAEEMNSGGRSTSGSSRDFLTVLAKNMTPPKADWRAIFRRAVASMYTDAVNGKQHLSYKRINRRFSGTILFPGTVDFNPKVIMGIDTSGSMGQEDYRRLLVEAEAIIKAIARGKDTFSVFCVDTEVDKIQPVRQMSDIDLRGGGGTIMAAAYKFVTGMDAKKRPSIFILSTDGYIDWDDVAIEVENAPYQSVILVTEKGGYDACPEGLRKKALVLDISS